jgi:predicted peptidase
MEAQVLAALEVTLREFHSDPRRVYLTGFSMGGYGTWLIAARHPNRFAALVPIAGGIVWPPPAPIVDETPYAKTAEKVARIPAWVFHGSADRNVLVTESREMIKLLRRVGANVRYTEYDGMATLARGIEPMRTRNCRVGSSNRCCRTCPDTRAKVKMRSLTQPLLGGRWLEFIYLP